MRRGVNWTYCVRECPRLISVDYQDVKFDSLYQFTVQIRFALLDGFFFIVLISASKRQNGSYAMPVNRLAEVRLHSGSSRRFKQTPTHAQYDSQNIGISLVF